MIISSHSNRSHGHLAGTLYAMAAFGIWGILPIYWKRLLEISPYEIVSNRVVWTCLFTGFLILFLKKKRLLKSVLRNRKQVWLILACALLLGVNWLTYIYAVNSGHVLDASMGYYINPLISVFLGILLLKERVSSIQKMAIFLAMIGVFLVVFEYGKIPWISLVLAFTFGFYGLFKKISGVDPIIGLAAETALMVPFSIIFQILLFMRGEGHLLRGTPENIVLLCLTGIVTAAPLLLFTAAAQRIPLSRVGFIQYLTPTCFFLLGRFVYREAFSGVQLASFICIWMALAIFSLSRQRIR